MAHPRHFLEDGLYDSMAHNITHTLFPSPWGSLVVSQKLACTYQPACPLVSTIAYESSAFLIPLPSWVMYAALSTPALGSTFIVLPDGVERSRLGLEK